MNIDAIKKELESEFSSGNTKTYKDLLNFCMRLWRLGNKNQIKKYNYKYYNKIKSFKRTINEPKKEEIRSENKSDFSIY
jgi:hypothetical protein